jgi:mannose-1-phosphate guanylyltransferase
MSMKKGRMFSPLHGGRMNDKNDCENSAAGSGPNANGHSGTDHRSSRLWSIILAGGNGDRIRAVIQRWKGRPIPKQYCAFVGKRSMLQHTIARADALAPPEHQLIVVAKSHQCEALPQLADRPQGTVVVQPCNCNTFAGVFLPLTHVYARDPLATVVIYPSDHFIYPEKDFLEVTAKAAQAAEELPDGLVLLGAPAERIELDYEYVLPGKVLWKSGKCMAHSLARFIGNPSLADAAAMKAGGGLWNSMIVAARARALWRLGWAYAPKVLLSFEESVLDAIYQAMPALNFSTDLLAAAADQIAVIPMEGIVWSDWGQAERVEQTLSCVGKQSNFSMILAGQRPVAANGSGQNDISRLSGGSGGMAS